MFKHDVHTERREVRTSTTNSVYVQKMSDRALRREIVIIGWKFTDGDKSISNGSNWIAAKEFATKEKCARPRGG